MSEEYQYDFAISVAGENRDTANSLDKLLGEGGAKVFYDRDFESHGGTNSANY